MQLTMASANESQRSDDKAPGSVSWPRSHYEAPGRADHVPKYGKSSASCRQNKLKTTVKKSKEVENSARTVKQPEMERKEGNE